VVERGVVLCLLVIIKPDGEVTHSTAE